MSKTQLKSFVDQFVAIVSGDADKVVAEKTFRQRNSALKSHISSYQGDTIDFEDKVDSRNENLEKTRLNKGKAITDRKQYIMRMFDAKNELEEAKEDLADHLEKIAFLEAEMAL